MAPPISVDVVEQRDGTVRITVAGELDVHTRLRLARALGLHEQDRVHLDLSGVTFADSAALHALVAACSASLRARGSLEIVAVSEPVRRLLRLVSGGSALLPV